MIVRRLYISALALVLAACASAQPAKQAVADMDVEDADSPEAAGMVDIRTLVPDIDLDMRYAGRDNFVGTRVEGYEAARCFLQVPAARALARVEAARGSAGARSQHPRACASGGGDQPVPLRVSFSVPRLTVDHRAEYALRCAAIDDGRRRILPRKVRRALEGEYRQVGPLARRERSDA